MPDYEGYASALEKVLEGVTKDYWSSFIDINRHQVNVGKTYLWVSIALIGLYVTGISKFQEHITANSCLLVLGGVSFLLSFAAFGICLYAIPARQGYKTIPNIGWGEFSEEAYNLLKDGSTQVYSTFLSSYITKIDHAYAYNFKTNQKRASLLRVTSWLLIGSFLIALFISCVIVVENTYSQQKETVMSEENKPTSNQPTSTEKPLEVPKPAPPANIGGTVSTHSADPEINSNTFITETKKPKE